ncbi:MAG: glutamate racemase [Clostridia bacterium]|nr:glutamate racemase [Clostridia bacterium]
MNKNGKIGIFDSGIGGVTVMRELMKVLPKENYYYYSDSKNNPYGDKTEEEIKKLCDNIVQYLIQQDCKMIVIACNTASAKAATFLRQKYPKINIVAIEPAYKMVYDYAYDKPTLVMATKGTIESEKFNLLLEKYDNHKTFLIPCVGLADRIEKGDLEQINEYLKAIIGNYKNKVENVVLGCTHYPLIEQEIEKVLGKVNFFNGAPNLAKHLKTILEQKNLLKDGEGKVEFEDSQGLLEKKIRFFEILENIGGTRSEIQK